MSPNSACRSLPPSLAVLVCLLQELCHALEGGPYYQHLDAAACPPPVKAATGGASTGDAAGAQPARQPADVQHALRLQPPPLLGNWCLPADKQASGWAAISDAACMQRAAAAQEAAVSEVRAGRGTVLFKHVHKAGGSTLCRLALQNMRAESPKLPNRSDWDTNWCVAKGACAARLSVACPLPACCLPVACLACLLPALPACRLLCMPVACFAAWPALLPGVPNDFTPQLSLGMCLPARVCPIVPLLPSVPLTSVCPLKRSWGHIQPCAAEPACWLQPQRGLQRPATVGRPPGRPSVAACRQTTWGGPAGWASSRRRSCARCSGTTRR